MIPVINKEQCTGCGKCEEVCPPGALVLQDNVISIDEELCEECGFCAAQCAIEAITIPFPKSGKR